MLFIYFFPFAFYKCRANFNLRCWSRATQDDSTSSPALSSTLECCALPLLTWHTQIHKKHHTHTAQIQTATGSTSFNFYEFDFSWIFLIISNAFQLPANWPKKSDSNSSSSCLRHIGFGQAVFGQVFSAFW